MPRALLTLDHAQCLRIDKGPQTAADMATDTWNKLRVFVWTAQVQAACRVRRQGAC